MTKQKPSTAQALWRDGLYRCAHQLASPNFNQRPAGSSISLLVVHSISLPPAVYGGDAVERLFLNQLDCDAHPYYERLRGVEVSAHFLIKRAGQLLQFVSCDARAWHAGESSFEQRPNCNDYSIGIELEGIDGGMFEAAQYDTLLALAQALAERYPLTAATAHSVIAPERKRDPGAGFEAKRLLAVPSLRLCF
jgi:N-acetyl-anhydromuramoyl-L-alanine amidase